MGTSTEVVTLELDLQVAELELGMHQEEVQLYEAENKRLDAEQQALRQHARALEEEAVRLQLRINANMERISFHELEAEKRGNQATGIRYTLESATRLQQMPG